MLKAINEYRTFFDYNGNLLVESQALRENKLLTPVQNIVNATADYKEAVELIRTEWKRTHCLKIYFSFV